MTKQYYGLKDFADRANDKGLKTSTEILSVYRRRGLLPEPAVMIGKRAGWSMDQIDRWIEEEKSKKWDGGRN
ncbi:hypothetical protein [Oceanobacillus luteolus]|uniref:Uncharacterized protein n=1 Tax=Oceanobacillus luteolus TaxID=1274358 RepID=A0ABW4HTR2_9BACI